MSNLRSILKTHLATGAAINMTLSSVLETSRTFSGVISPSIRSEINSVKLRNTES